VKDHISIVTCPPGAQNRIFDQEPCVHDWPSYVAFIKDVPGDGQKDSRPFAPVTLAETPGQRTNETFIGRHVATLDADNAGSDFVEAAEKVLRDLGLAGLIQSTDSHDPDAGIWKYRVHVPLQRMATGGEYRAVVRDLMECIGIERFDVKASLMPVGLVFAPVKAHTEFVEIDGTAAPVDGVTPEPWGASERVEWDRDAPLTEQQKAKARSVLDKYAWEVSNMRDKDSGADLVGRNSALIERLPTLYRFEGAGALAADEIYDVMFEAACAAPAPKDAGPWTEREYAQVTRHAKAFAADSPQAPTVPTPMDDFGIWDGPVDDGPDEVTPEPKQTRLERETADQVRRLRALQAARDILAAETAGDAQGWEPIDLNETLAGLADGSLTRPLPTVGDFGQGCLFYAGRVNGVHGDSNGGKSWTALIVAAQEINAGNAVVYVDLEDDAQGVLSRLIHDLGVDPQVVQERFVYLRPGQPFTPSAVPGFKALLARVRPSLVVLDSTGEALAVSGINPNADDEVARWFTLMPSVAADAGACVLLIDHATKATTNELWPIGSQRKKAAITGAAYLQKNVAPFSRTQEGHSVLKCAKDRHGNYALKQEVAMLVASFGSLTLRPGPDAGSQGDWKPTALMEKVSRRLEGLPAGEQGWSLSKIEREVGGNKAHLGLAVKALVSGGWVAVVEGSRNARLHSSIKPYREIGLD
jgi:hypothetical protein